MIRVSTEAPFVALLRHAERVCYFRRVTQEMLSAIQRFCSHVLASIPLDASALATGAHPQNFAP